MKILVSGGTGFVGSNLTRLLLGKGHDVTVITRNAGKNLPDIKGLAYFYADPNVFGPWQSVIDEQDIIINLAGSNIFQVWNDKTKEKIYNSRINVTKNIVKALKKEVNQNKTLINASAIGYYGFHEDDTKLTESAPAGTDFLALVCRDWENEALKAEEFGIRVIRCRFGIVLGEEAGALKIMLPAFKLGLGSALGNGNQWFSWVHKDDLCHIIEFLMTTKNITGAVNCTAPNPVRNRELTQILAKVLNRPVILPDIPGFILKGILGELGNVLLNGQRVIPERLEKAGFTFKYPAIEEALQNLLNS
jgi:uncharacterized protein